MCPNKDNLEKLHIIDQTINFMTLSKGVHLLMMCI